MMAMVQLFFDSRALADLLSLFSLSLLFLFKKERNKQVSKKVPLGVPW